MTLKLVPQKPIAHTPIKQTHIMLDEVVPRYNLTRPMHVLEPAAGKGNIIKTLLQRDLDIRRMTAIEILPKFEKRLYRIIDNFRSSEVYCPQDFLKVHTSGIIYRYDLIVGNPPYGGNIELDFVLHSLKLLNYGGLLIFLLKLSFLETVERYKNLWSIRQPDGLMPLAKRIPFYGGSRGDRYSYCWFVWHNIKRPTQWHKVLWNG